MDTNTETVKGIDLRLGMYIVIGLQSVMITDLAPLRSYTNHGLHVMTGKTLVTVLSGDENIPIVIQNDHEYEVGKGF